MRVSAIHNRPADQWREVRRMACGLAKTFSARFGRPYAEMLGVSDDALSSALLEKHHLYDPSKAKLTTWVYYRVYWALMEHGRTMARLKGRETALNDHTHDRPHEPQWLTQMMADLEQEGRELILTVLTAPPEVQAQLRRAHMAGADGKSLRNLVRSHLRAEGWPKHRIRISIRQVRRSMRQVG